jgi:hypothetical protein
MFDYIKIKNSAHQKASPTVREDICNIDVWVTKELSPEYVKD